MILVTGGTGFVGRHLVRALVSRGDAVRVLSRAGHPRLQEPGVQLVHADFADQTSVDRAARGVRCVVHLAAQLSEARKTDESAFRFNVDSTRAIAKAARRERVARFIHVSSGGVYGDGSILAPHRETDPPRPGTAYESSKLAAEKVLAEVLGGSDTMWGIVRPAGIFAHDRPATVHFVGEVQSHKVWLHGNANVIVHPTHVSDLVQGCIRLMQTERVNALVVNIAGERALRYQEFVSLTALMLGVRARQIVIPSLGGWAAARAAAVVRRAGRRVPPAVDRAGRPVINRALDTTRARELLGFVPTNLDTALRETVAEIVDVERRASRAGQNSMIVARGTVE